MDNQIPEKTKGGHLWFLEFKKSSKFLKEIDERAYAATKCQMDSSVRANYLKREV